MALRMSYPLQTEISGTTVTVRPIKASDAPMEAAFVHGLSSQSKHYRFMGGITDLSPQMLARLCDVDGQASMGFIATIDQAGEEIQIGVSRYAPNHEPDTRDIAITVADNWQRKGLGTLLATHLIDYAKRHGVNKLRSIDLADNARMKELAKALGMSMRRDPTDPHQVIYSLTL